MFTTKSRKTNHGELVFDVYKNGLLHVSAMSPRLIKHFFNLEV